MSVKRVKVLVLVKTYPVLSQKYGELVCTAGITEEGKWIRLYPLPFRLLGEEKKYSKYQWIEVDVQRKEDDFRPESYRVVNVDTITLLESIDPSHGWRERKRILFKFLTVYRSISELIGMAQKENSLSLALFKPNRILDFVIEPCERTWNTEREGKSYQAIQQGSLFDSDEERERRETFKIVKKIPYKFSYKFLDVNNKECTLMIEDWELGQLYWHYIDIKKTTEEFAQAKVREKYFDEFTKKDIHLYLGTTKQYHGWANNPFIVIGVFYPPKVAQPEFDIFD